MLSATTFQGSILEPIYENEYIRPFEPEESVQVFRYFTPFAKVPQIFSFIKQFSMERKDAPAKIRSIYFGKTAIGAGGENRIFPVAFRGKKGGLKFAVAVVAKNEGKIVSNFVEKALVQYPQKDEPIIMKTWLGHDPKICDPTQKIIIRTFTPHGDCHKYLQKNPGADKIQLSHQLVRKYVRFWQLGWVHRDIKLENILVDKNGDATLTDFGFSQKYAPGIHKITKGTPFAYPPEYRKGIDLLKADFYAFGVMLIDMWNPQFIDTAPKGRSIYEEIENCQRHIQSNKDKILHNIPDRNLRAFVERMLFNYQKTSLEDVAAYAKNQQLPMEEIVESLISVHIDSTEDPYGMPDVRVEPQEGPRNVNGGNWLNDSGAAFFGQDFEL